MPRRRCTPSRSSLARALALAAVAALVLVGCGSSGGATSSGDGDSSTTAAGGYGGGGGGGGSTTTAADKGDTALAGLEQQAGLTGKVNLKDDDDLEATAGDDVDMDLYDYSFGPVFLHATAGQKITVNLHNEGDAAHTFTIDSLKIDTTLQPGDKATVEVTAPQSGSVAYYCRFHKAMGMQGAIIVSD